MVKKIVLIAMTSLLVGSALAARCAAITKKGTQCKRNDGTGGELDCFGTVSLAMTGEEAAEKNWCGVYEYALTLGDMKVKDAAAVKAELAKQFAVQLAEAKEKGLEDAYLAYLCDEVVIQGMKWQLAFVAKHGAQFERHPDALKEYNAYVEPLYAKVSAAHPQLKAIHLMELATEEKQGSFVQALKEQGAIEGTFLLKAKALND